MSYTRLKIPKFYFKEFIEDLFNCKYLSRLHKLSCNQYKTFEVTRDSITEFHQKFYDMYRAGWPLMVFEYERLIHLLSKEYNGPILYQKFPTFRVHLPGNLAVGAFHTDGEFGHPEGEINYIIPLTDADKTASVWVETSEGNNYFTDMKMKVGELITFNGNKLRHGNKVNEEGYTRVSMDFRILPASKYTVNQTESMTMKTKFIEGEYYKRYEGNL